MKTDTYVGPYARLTAFIKGVLIMKLPFGKMIRILEDKNSQDTLRNIFRDTLTSSSLILFLMTPPLYFKNFPTIVWLIILTISILSCLFVLSWAIYTLRPQFEDLLQRDTKINRACFAIWVTLIEFGITFSISRLFISAIKN